MSALTGGMAKSATEKNLMQDLVDIKTKIENG